MSAMLFSAGAVVAADLVLRGAVVHTMDPQKPEAQAIAIRGNRIVAVGSSEHVAPFVGPGSKVLDLAGHTVVPGFHESHGHFLNLGLARMNVDLVGTRSYADVVARVAAAVKQARSGEWIVGRGWHEGKWTDTSSLTVRGFPTHHALSAVSPDNPVYLTRADGHAGLANARAMEVMGIGRDTRAPEGGDILRDARGDPTGILVDNAQALVRVPPPSATQRRRALALAMDESLAKGITRFTDAGADLETIALYKELMASDALALRLYVMIRGLENARRFGNPEIGLGGGFLTIRAVKLWADGALGSRGAALLEPYADDPGNSGFFTTPPAEVLAAARFCLDKGFQLAVHAIGDRGNRMVLDQMEAAFAGRPRDEDRRFRIEHAQILDEDDSPRFAKLGVLASMQGIHCTSDRPWAGARLGAARVAEGAYVWRKLYASGARILNGTDAPVEDLDPLKSFYASVTRQDESGQPPGGFDPDQKMTREEALRSYTLDAAYGSFTEKELGSIEVGKLADLTVLTKDILKVPDAEILQARVAYTIVDGRVRYDGGLRSRAAWRPSRRPPHALRRGGR